MKGLLEPVAEGEPVGIVISGGVRREPVPMVRAYIYGPVPDAPRPEAGKKKRG
jgi:hypothetical protein